MTRSYFATMVLLVLHQIDAAYWREWEMFHLPGGIQGFLLFNILVVPLVFLGYQHVILSSPKALVSAAGCAALGIATFVIHAGFAVAGHEQFQLPLSMAIIVLCLGSALWLLWELRGFRSSTAVMDGRRDAIL